MKLTLTRSLTAATVAAALALAGCSNSEEPSTAQSSTTATAAPATSAATEDPAASNSEQKITFTNGVVRAMAADSDMTSIFGTLTNTSDETVTITGFETSLNAPMNQMHEVVDGVMQEIEGGFELGAGESLELAPGGNHFMVMGVDQPVAAGDTVAMTLELSDGSTVDVGEIPVREIGAGDENYGDIEGGAEMSEHMGGMAGMSEAPGMEG